MTEENTTALALRPGADVEVMSYFDEATKLLAYATERVITEVKDYKVATDDLSILAKLKKSMEEKRKEYLAPHQAQVAAINETYKILMVPILAADQTTREKMLAYTSEQERIRLEQEDINRKRLEAATQEQKLKGELSESVNLVEVVPEATKKASTELGTAGQRDNWCFEVTDFALLPDEYKVADSAMLHAIAKKHHDQKQVPGVRFYNQPIIAVRTR